MQNSAHSNATTPRQRTAPATTHGVQPTRRALLQGTGALTGTLALSSALAALAPSRAWALDLGALSTHQGKVVLTFSRHLYPHPTLEDAVYALVVKELDGKAATDRAAQQTLLSGVRELDQIGDGDWLKRDPALQLIDVESMEGMPFFILVRTTAVVTLYANDMAFAHFGYGGKEGQFGYLRKGFNDLTWLPEMPAAASGPVPQN